MDMGSCSAQKLWALASTTTIPKMVLVDIRIGMALVKTMVHTQASLQTTCGRSTHHNKPKCHLPHRLSSCMRRRKCG
eukprot:m.193185 g.193185  ORF g.193185 m.193185 type:complete len:77 (+) comp15664_c0_seq2:1365-1595(+)